MFEPKRKWFNEIDWEDRTVLLKGILSIKEEDYGRFTELALDAGMGEALAEESGEWAFSEEDPRIWRYTFDGEKMRVKDGRFVF